MTIAEYLKNNKLFKSNNFLTFIGEFRPYKENKCVKWFTQEWREQLDEYFFTNYYDYKLLFEDSEMLGRVINSVFNANSNKYNNMYGALYHYQFNPLWNVDGMEKITTNYGKVVNTTDLGESNGTTTSATRSGSTTNKVNGYNDVANELRTDNKSEWESIGATDRIHQDAVQNEQTTNEHTDVMTHERSGNIGVAKSTELLEDTIKFYRNNLLEEIAHDVVKKICLGVL